MNSESRVDEDPARDSPLIELTEVESGRPEYETMSIEAPWLSK